MVNSLIPSNHYYLSHFRPIIFHNAVRRKAKSFSKYEYMEKCFRYFYSSEEVYMKREAEMMFAWSEVWDMSRRLSGV